jgi:hypothetical protein
MKQPASAQSNDLRNGVLDVSEETIESKSKENISPLSNKSSKSFVNKLVETEPKPTKDNAELSRYRSQQTEFHRMQDLRTSLTAELDFRLGLTKQKQVFLSTLCFLDKIS